MLVKDPLKLVGNAVFCHFYLVIAIATTRCCSGVERIPEHIPVFTFVSPRVNSLMFERSSVFPRQELR